jgi:hypothetical protein
MVGTLAQADGHDVAESLVVLVEHNQQRPLSLPGPTQRDAVIMLPLDRVGHNSEHGQSDPIQRGNHQSTPFSRFPRALAKRPPGDGHCHFMTMKCNGAIS